MPVGVIVDALAVVIGGIVGAVVGKKLKKDFIDNMNLILGCCSMCMGVSTIVLMQHMPAVVFAIILGTGLGLAVHFGKLINKGGLALQKGISRFVKTSSDVPEAEFEATLVTCITLFCASGTGIYGSIIAGMSADHSVLIAKAILDLFTAVVFACTLGMVTAAVAIPQFIIFFLIGIWHGAEWKYIAFGFYNGTLIVLGILFEEPLRNLAEKLHINTKCFSWHLFQILRTLVLVALGKIITRAAGFSISVSMMHSMIVNWDTDILFNGGLLQLGMDSKDLWVLVLASLVLLAVSIMQECGIKVRETLAKQNLYFRWAVYLCAVFSLIIFGVYGLNYNAADFIYRGF